jgi:hypothetical protein
MNHSGLTALIGLKRAGCAETERGTVPIERKRVILLREAVSEVVG